MDPFKLIEKHINTDNNLIQSIDEINRAIEHIVQQLSDAYMLYENNSFSSSVFMSITACEEVAKAHLGSFTDGTTAKGKPKNIFRDHKTKHILSALPTVPMGSRLEKAIGKAELTKMMNMAHNSGFAQLRESALYFQREKDTLVVPSDKIDKKTARSILLFALEIFDDALVGVTTYSMEIDKKTDSMFNKLANGE